MSQNKSIQCTNPCDATFQCRTMRQACTLQLSKLHCLGEICLQSVKKFPSKEDKSGSPHQYISPSCLSSGSVCPPAAPREGGRALESGTRGDGCYVLMSLGIWYSFPWGISSQCNVAAALDWHKNGSDLCPTSHPAPFPPPCTGKLRQQQAKCSHFVRSSPFCIPVASSSNQKLTSLAIGKY